MITQIKFFVILIITLSISGCGYTTGSLLPSHLENICIKNFQNKIDVSSEPSDRYGYRIYRPGLESDVTKAVINQFIFDGNLRVVDEDDADLLLSGEVVDYYKQPLRYDRLDNIEEYRVIVTINMELKDAAKDKVLWRADNFIGYDTYRLTGALASNEDEAREKAIKDLAEKIVEKVIEAW